MTPIAIVGAGCEVPGASSPAELWELVASGRDAVSEVPPGRWRLPREHAVGNPDAPDPDRTWSTRGGYVTRSMADLDVADLLLDREVLDGLDPVFVLPIACAKAALREAGFRPGDLPPRSKGWLGNLSFPTEGMSAWAESVWTSGAATGLPPVDPRNRFSSGLPALMLAEALGLGDGALALDAACASSLYAIALACEALDAGRVDFALAGAVNRCDDLFIHVGFCSLGAISKTGRSRPFDAAADGLLPAEGCAMLALMRHDDAAAQGRPVLGVIRGVGLSNDGRGRGFLAPSARGQVRAMREALRSAGLSPGDVSYVECHATGTPVGDSTELHSLAEVYGAQTVLPVGSLKSNLGHLVTAAGAAGLIKVLGAFSARQLPPTLHVSEPTPALAATCFEPVSALREWPAGRPLRAAVSAFGFGGNNAHIIVEAAAETGRAPDSRAGAPDSRAGAPDSRAGDSARADLAVAGIGVIAHQAKNAAEFSDRLREPAPAAATRPAPSVKLDPSKLRFPPSELKRSLAQQNYTLAAVLEAIAGVDLPTADRLGVIVGMGADAEVARFGLRWRLATMGLPTADKDDVIDPLDADAVVGTMPNIPANRLNRQIDAGGFGFTVSSEELSGVDALATAGDLLRAGTVDAVVVAAADFCVEPVHQAALARLAVRVAGDAAVALVVRLATDCPDPIATITEAGEQPEFDSGAVEARFGHPHAARGLLEIAAAVVGDEPARVRIAALGGRTKSLGVRPLKQPPRRDGASGVEVPAHPPVLTLGVHRLAPAPALASPRGPHPARRLASCSAGVVATALDQPVRAAGPPGAEALLSAHTALVAAHRAHIELTTTAYASFQRLRAASLGVPIPHPGGASNDSRAVGVTPKSPGSPADHGVDAHDSRASQADSRATVEAAVQAVRPAPLFDRAALEFLSRHEISRYFGPEFAAQDGFVRQVRMPTPPMLLCDRVERIDAVPRSMGRGSVVTETDVVADAWYMHHGAMPAGIMIESGQADLLLISWLGIDFLNRGERVYRLLGCDLTYRRGLPRPGETLRYDIHVDGHAKHGDVRLFFFHYDCRVGPHTRLEVRNGQAGFFTDAELTESMGVLWDPSDDAPSGEAPQPELPARTARESFDRAAIDAFAAGEGASCFGASHRRLLTHTRTPTIPGGRMNLLGDHVTIDFAGGPWGRGHLRAVDAITPTDWFFEGHFHNDPCMPGTLMFEGCLQAMAFYLAAAGHTLDRDGWRFEPVPDVSYPLRCRGQVIPSSRELVTELFVREVRGGANPTIVADLLCTVDGLKAFHCRAMGVRLVPDWPQSTMTPERVSTRPVAHIGDLPTDENAMIASAWGAPRRAFGSLYDTFSPDRRIPRLPGPPYLFITRIAAIEGGLGSMRAGARVVAEYDIRGDEWYFAESPHPDCVAPARVMPFAVLVEAALQPCGWLASYLGGALASTSDLLFRNLDGDGTLHAQIPARESRLVTDVTCTRWSRSGETIICAFDVHCDLDGVRVYDLKTVFGFFTSTALATQVGLPPDERHAAMLTAPSSMQTLRGGSVVRDARTAPLGALRLLDRVGYVESAGVGLAIRAEQDVDPGEWFFKAHFFQDPVMPGSLGLEQMQQALQWHLLQQPGAAALQAPVFDAIGSSSQFIWRYRGQVIPERRVTAVTLEIHDSRAGDGWISATADASLWVDGLRIYEGRGLVGTLRSGR